MKPVDIALQHATQVFQTDAAQIAFNAFDDSSLKISDSELSDLLGLSGCSKTIILGLIRGRSRYYPRSILNQPKSRR